MRRSDVLATNRYFSAQVASGLHLWPVRALANRADQARDRDQNL